MKIDIVAKLQKSINKIIPLIIIILSPYVSNAQGCQILDTLVIDDLCWDPVMATGTLTIVPDDSLAAYNYSIDDGTIVTTVLATEFPPFSSNWFNAPGDSVFPISPGTYYIWLQEASNPSCYWLDTITILNPMDSLTTVTSVTQGIICHGDSTGEAEVATIGGILPYTYFWDSEATDSVVYNLWSGTHDVIVTDAYGCESVASVFIDNTYDPFSVDLDTIQQVQCYGGEDGAVILNVTGGAGNYDFDWSTGQSYYGPSPDTLFNLQEGGHNVVIEDDYGCDTVVFFIISEPPQLYAIATSIQPVQCFDFNDGQAWGYGTGGAAINSNDYTYSWSFDTLVNGTNDTIIDLIPGIHTVTVTDTNGCTAIDTVLITEPDQLYVEIPDSSAVYSYCLPTYSGSLVAQAYGGTPFPDGTYDYSWFGTAQTTASISNLHSGIYTVTVFDDRACVATATFNLDSITNTFIADSVDLTVSHVSCYGSYDGSININGISGSEYAPYIYTWSGPLPFTSINSNLIDDLYEGNYSVVIEDSLGCTMNLDADVFEPDQLQYSIDYIVNESCVGSTGSSCDGSIVLSINGGTGPYFYDGTFSGAFPIVSANQVPVVNDTLMTGFCNGAYTIDITDINGCQGNVYPGGLFLANIGSDVHVVNTGINPAIPITSCFNTADGIAAVDAPSSILNYTWESVSSPAGVLDTGLIYHNFSAGDYSLVAHYADSASFGINYLACDVIYNFTVNPGNMINSGAVVTNPTCYGDSDGMIVLDPTGTASPFVFLWDTLSSLSNYTLQNQIQLAPGVYTVSITDDDGCILIESFSVNEPNPITATFTNVNDVSCHGLGDGTAKVVVDPTSGQDPFIYSWNTNPSQTSANATGLNGGTYIVTVTDSGGFGCSADFSVNIVDPDPIITSVEPNSFWGEDDFGNPFHISCNGGNNGSIIVGSVGGTGTVSFDWQDSNNQTVSLGALADNLSAGSYTLYATDDNDCDEDTTIILNEPDLILPNITDTLYDFNGDGIGTEISCFGLFDGWALSSPTGGYPGVQGYLYDWVNSNGQNVSSQALADNLPALLSYTVTVTDMNGCSQTATTVVFTQPLLFDADVITTNYSGPSHAPFIVNFIDNTNSLDSYTYVWSWDDGFTDQNLEFTREDIGLNEVYVVLSNTVTGCTDTVFFDIEIQGIPDVNNIFTPNSDGINDEFSFGEFGMSTVSVEVYNRWGQMIYTWSGENKSWSGVDISGEAVPEGVYFYVLEAEGADGYYYEQKGTVTLLR